ncbi:MAG: aldehyde dehydrogenase family protein, partial [Rhodospirillaceae bacterium]
MDVSAKTINETMRIGGRKVDGTEGRIDVMNPFTGAIVGTVPRAGRDQVREAFAIAKAYKPTLTRYERQQILIRTAELLVSRRDEISDLITAESGLSKKDSLYEVGRAFDVFTLAGQLCILDDGEIFSCDLTPHGQKRKIFTQREPLLGVISAITPFNHPLNMVAHKVAPSIATNNRMVCKPTELTPLTCLVLADVLYEAGLPPEMFQIISGLPADVGD